MSFDGRTLSNISVLAAIVESGSFARAADALGLSPSGVSRAVGRLESSIGVRLLDRTTRSVTLTDEGRQLYEEIGPLLTGIGDAVTLAAGASAAVPGALACERRCIFFVQDAGASYREVPGSLP